MDGGVARRGGPSCSRGFRGLPGAGWPGRGETAGVMPASGPPLSPAARPERLLLAGGVAALASKIVLAIIASERVPRAGLRRRHADSAPSVRAVRPAVSRRHSARRLCGSSRTRASRGARGMFISSELVRLLNTSRPRGPGNSP